jgi:hypothetical protein
MKNVQYLGIMADVVVYDAKVLLLAMNMCWSLEEMLIKD